MGRKGKKKTKSNEEAAPVIPAPAMELVESLMKEFRDYTVEEIYALLKEERDMDPDCAREKLRYIGTFQKVESKPRRRKEKKEALDSASKANKLEALHLASKDNAEFSIHESEIGRECNVVQSASTLVTYDDKEEVASVCPSVTSSMNHVVEENTNSSALPP